MMDSVVTLRERNSILSLITLKLDWNLLLDHQLTDISTLILPLNLFGGIVSIGSCLISVQTLG